MLTTTPVTIGRILWLWVPGLDGVKDLAQAFAAQVVHVHLDNTVDVRATTHTGATLYLESLQVYDPGDDAHGQEMLYCTWMPYQKAQEAATQVAQGGAKAV